MEQLRRRDRRGCLCLQCTGGTSLLYALRCIHAHSAGENLFQEESVNELI